MRVARLRASAVKGLLQDEVAALTLVADGIVEDRRFVCVDESMRALYALELRGLATARAAWDAGAGTLAVRFADGSEVAAALELVGDETDLRTWSGREMHGRLVAGPFAEAMSEVAGRPLRLFHIRIGQGGPGRVTVLGDGSLRRLADELGIDRLDGRRFRMTIELEGVEPHAEDGWQTSRLQVGETVLEIGAPVPRCALTTRDPASQERDLDTLRVLLDYRGALETGEPPFGVYANVVTPGVVRVGDAADLLG